jgi:hypothetical protein
MGKKREKPHTMIRLAAPQPAPAMRFDVSIRINLNEMDVLSPEQVRAVMLGIAQVVAVSSEGHPARDALRADRP